VSFFSLSFLSETCTKPDIVLGSKDREAELRKIKDGNLCAIVIRHRDKGKHTAGAAGRGNSQRITTVSHPVLKNQKQEKWG
jgi:hypothetical protein